MSNSHPYRTFVYWVYKRLKFIHSLETVNYAIICDITFYTTKITIFPFHCFFFLNSLHPVKNRNQGIIVIRWLDYTSLSSHAIPEKGKLYKVMWTFYFKRKQKQDMWDVQEGHYKLSILNYDSDVQLTLNVFMDLTRSNNFHYENKHVASSSPSWYFLLF